MALGLSAGAAGLLGSLGGAVIGGIASNGAAKKGAAAMDRATAANAYQGEIAKDQYEDYKVTYRPLEHALVNDAQNFDTPEAYEKAAGEAQSTVSTQLGLAKDRLARTPGLDPSSASAQAAHADLELKGAAIGATAQNSARTGIQDKAWARKMDAVGLGKGLVTNASTGLANATAGANAAAANQMAQANNTARGVGNLVSGIGGAVMKSNLFSGGGGQGAETNNTGDAGWTNGGTLTSADTTNGSSGYPVGETAGGR